MAQQLIRVRRAAEGECEVNAFDPQRVRGALAALPTEGELERLQRLFKLLGSPTRLRLLFALDGRELCVCDLAQVLGMSTSATSQELGRLRNEGLVAYRAEGKMAYYRLASGKIMVLIRAAKNHGRG